MFTRTGRNNLGNQRGTAMVEMALVSGLFFMALLPIYDFGRSWYVQSNLQHATRSTARLVTVGALGSSVSALSSTAVGALLSEQSGMNLESAVIAVSSRPLAGSGSGTGTSGELITVTAHMAVPLVTPFLQPFFAHGVFHAKASATFLNEVVPTGV